MLPSATIFAVFMFPVISLAGAFLVSQVAMGKLKLLR